MEKHRAIPEGDMKVGELAKKANISVRTLQYYDKEGLLSPSGSSEGGFRLYSDKDMAKLVQILFMKQLGFTLADIKKRLASLDTPADVVNVLTEHAANIRKKVELFTESLNEIEALKAEIVQMDAVNFKKFAAILATLQAKNANYWMIKHFDDDVITILSECMDREKAEAVSRSFNEAAKFLEEDIAPESEKGQDFAKRYWETMMEMSGGSMDMLQKVSEQVVKIINSGKSPDKMFAATHHFIKRALEIYMGAHSNTEVLSSLYSEAAKLQRENAAPESEKVQSFAKAFWENLMEATGGDMDLIQKMSEHSVKTFGSGENQNEAFMATHRFVEAALEVYFSNRHNGL